MPRAAEKADILAEVLFPAGDAVEAAIDIAAPIRLGVQYRLLGVQYDCPLQFAPRTNIEMPSAAIDVIAETAITGDRFRRIRSSAFGIER